MSNPRFEAPSWNQVYEMLIRLALEVRQSGFVPEVIVGVSRGGWPPARIMSDLLGVENLANMRVVFYKDIGLRNKRPVITQPVSSNVRSKRVLVVDDVSDSGHSLRVVSTHLNRKRAGKVKVCTLYLKPRSIFVPDYYAKRTGKWIIFPWERLEAVRQISRKAGRNERTGFVLRALKGTGLGSGLIRQLLRLTSDDGGS